MRSFRNGSGNIERGTALQSVVDAGLTTQLAIQMATGRNPDLLAQLVHDYLLAIRVVNAETMKRRLPCLMLDLEFGN